MVSAKEWLLKIANEVRNNPKVWTQGTLARDAKGDKVSMSPVFRNSAEAVCWCAVGFGHRDGIMDAAFPWEPLEKASGIDNVSEYNDHEIKTPSEFVAWFERAAALLPS